MFWKSVYRSVITAAAIALALGCPGVHGQEKTPEPPQQQQERKPAPLQEPPPQLDPPAGKSPAEAPAAKPDSPTEFTPPPPAAPPAPETTPDAPPAPDASGGTPPPAATPEQKQAFDALMERGARELRFAAKVLNVAPRAKPLTTTRQIRALGPAAGHQRALPVKLTGVVTFRDTLRGWFTLQDETGGVMIEPDLTLPRPAPGTSVTITGITKGGMYDACVNAGSLVIHGPAPWPAAQKSTLTELSKSRHFAQWIEVEGVIVDIEKRRASLWVVLFDGNTYVSANILSYDGTPPATLRDSRVRIRGINWDAYTAVMQTPAYECIDIVREGWASVFDAPAMNAAEMKLLKKPSTDRYRCRGVVRHKLGQNSVFLVDGEIRFFLQLLPRWPRVEPTLPDTFPSPPLVPLAPGDEVEVVGAPLVTGDVLELGAGSYRITGRNQPLPPATVTTPEDLAAGRHQGDLVTVRGNLVKVHESPVNNITYYQLSFEDSGVVYRADFSSTEKSAFSSIPPDYYVECTGFYTLVNLPDGPLRRIYPRSKDDIRAIRPSSSAIARTFWQVATGVIIVGAFGVAWIWFLRRQVRRRTAALAEANLRLQESEAELKANLDKARELTELKSQFVSTVSHEFRTPLGVILSSADILTRYHDRLPEEKRLQHLQTIARRTQSLAGLMEEVLLLSKVESGKMHFDPAPVDLDQLCRTLADEIVSATNGQCPIQFRGGVNGHCARADEGLIRHIVSNLLSNAVKYSPPGAPVDFIVSHEGRDAVFTVRDRGIGIPEEDLPHVFESFQRGRNVGQRQGTGLGLVIVKRCVDIHGGKISLSSSPGEGTTARVKLPVFSRSPEDTATLLI